MSAWHHNLSQHSTLGSYYMLVLKSNFLGLPRCARCVTKDQKLNFVYSWNLNPTTSYICQRLVFSWNLLKNWALLPPPKAGWPKQSHIPTNSCPGQPKQVQTSLPGWGMKIHAKSQERKEGYLTKQKAVPRSKVWNLHGGREKEVQILIFIWPCSCVLS